MADNRCGTCQFFDVVNARVGYHDMVPTRWLDDQDELERLLAGICRLSG